MFSRVAFRQNRQYSEVRLLQQGTKGISFFLIHSVRDTHTHSPTGIRLCFCKHFWTRGRFSCNLARRGHLLPPCRVPEQIEAQRGRLRGGLEPRHRPGGSLCRPTIPTAALEARPGSPQGTPLLPFRRKKDMAGPGSGRRARGDCRGEGPAPFIQQPARTSGSAAFAALARKETLPGVGPTASSRCPESSRRHIINKPPARSSGPSPREASREAARRPRPRPRPRPHPPAPPRPAPPPWVGAALAPPARPCACPAGGGPAT